MPVHREIKTAIIDVLRTQVDRSNYGIFARYNASLKSLITVRENKIEIGSSVVKMDGKPIYKVKRLYADKKVNGRYEQLTPKLEAVEEEEQKITFRIIYDFLAVINFMLFCFVGGSEGISLLGNLVFGSLSFAACCYFVKLSFKYDKNHSNNGNYRNTNKAA